MAENAIPRRRSRWRVWLPPILVAIVVLLLLLLLKSEESGTTFRYRLF